MLASGLPPYGRMDILTNTAGALILTAAFLGFRPLLAGRQEPWELFSPASRAQLVQAPHAEPRALGFAPRRGR